MSILGNTPEELEEKRRAALSDDERNEEDRRNALSDAERNEEDKGDEPESDEPKEAVKTKKKPTLNELRIAHRKSTESAKRIDAERKAKK